MLPTLREYKGEQAWPGVRFAAFPLQRLRQDPHCADWDAISPTAGQRATAGERGVHGGWSVYPQDGGATGDVGRQGVPLATQVSAVPVSAEAGGADRHRGSGRNPLPGFLQRPAQGHSPRLEEA